MGFHKFSVVFQKNNYLNIYKQFLHLINILTFGCNVSVVRIGMCFNHLVNPIAIKRSLQIKGRI